MTTNHPSSCRSSMAPWGETHLRTQLSSIMWYLPKKKKSWETEVLKRVEFMRRVAAKGRQILVKPLLDLLDRESD